MSSPASSIKIRERSTVAHVFSAAGILASILLVILLSELELIGIRELLVILSLVFLYLSLKFPEVGFAMFLNAGMFKDDPRLAALTSAIDLTTFFWAATLLGGLYGIWRGSIRVSRPPYRLVVPFLAIATLATLSLVYTSAPLYAREKLFRFLTLTTLAFVGPWFLLRTERRLRLFFAAFVTLSTLMVLQVLLGGDLQRGEFAFQAAFSSGYLGLGSTCAQAVLILAWYFLPGARSFLAKLAFIGLLLLNIFGSLVSGARGSALALGFTLLGALIYRFWNSFRGSDKRVVPARVLKTLGSFGVFVVLGVVLFNVFGQYFETLSTRTDILFSDASVTQEERIDLYRKSVALITSFPRGLMGLGIGGWTTYYYGFDAPRGGFPHNLFLEVGTELGWGGLVSIIALLWWAAMEAFKMHQGRMTVGHGTFLVVVTLFVYMTVYSCFHGDINDFRNLFAWVGAIYASKQAIAS